MNNLRRTLTALAMSSVIMFSGHTMAQESITNEEMRTVVEMIKLEMAQHPGIQAYYNEENQTVLLSGYSDDTAYVNGLVTKLKSLPHVKDVRSTITTN